MIPPWILDIAAAIMLAVAGLSAGRLLAARPWSRPAPEADIDAAHVLMGTAMAGMLASGLQTLPSGAWAAVFAAVTGWFGWRVAADARGGSGAAGLCARHHLPHLVHGAAMVYMFVAVRGPAGHPSAGMSGMGGTSPSVGTLQVPTLALLFVLFMAGWAVWDLDQLSGRQAGLATAEPVPGTVGTGTVGRPDARVTTGCRIAMGITMALMLVLMI